MSDADTLYLAALEGKNKLYAEMALAFMRRCFIANMRDPASTTIAIMLTGFEEIIMRTTLKARDKMLEDIFHLKLVTKPKHRPLIRKVEDVLWEVSIGNAMMAEVSCIMLRFGATIFMWQHRHVYSLGFPSEDATQIVYWNLALEIFSEVVVDIIASYHEIRSGISIDKFFDNVVRPSHFTQIFAHFFTGSFFAMFVLLRTPNVLFCESEDVCSCDLENDFYLYQSICNGTNLSSTTDSAVSELESNEVMVLFIGIVSFVGISAIAVAASMHLKSRRQRQVAADLRHLVFKKEASIQKLQGLFDEEKQEMAEKAMKAARFAPLEPYKVSHSHITFDRRIGEGAVGEVWLGSLRGLRVAIKKFTSGTEFESALDTFSKEALVMALLQGDLGISHPNLVQMVHCCWEGELLLLLDYYPLGSLGDALENGTQKLEW